MQQRIARWVMGLVIAAMFGLSLMSGTTSAPVVYADEATPTATPTETTNGQPGGQGGGHSPTTNGQPGGQGGGH